MRKNSFLIGILVLFLSLSFQMTAKEIGTVATFKEAEAKIQKAGEKFKPGNVLLVFDFDCTLITAADNFGSDVWWDWQSRLLANDPESPYLVSKDIGELLFYQGIIQQFTSSYPTEEGIPDAIKEFQEQGFETLVLTSRGPETLNRTESQIKQIDMDFSNSEIGPSIGGAYSPYDINEPGKYGLSQADITNFNLKPPRAVRYDTGVMYTSGQNKGIMLKTLLYKLDRKFKAIVFLDDTQKHVDALWAVFKNSSIDINSYRYAFDDSIKRQFKMSNKHQVIQQWKELRSSINNIYGKTLELKDK